VCQTIGQLQHKVLYNIRKTKDFLLFLHLVYVGAAFIKQKLKEVIVDYYETLKINEG